MLPQLVFQFDTKLCDAVTWEGRNVIHKDLDMLQSWTCLNLMKFNKAKRKVLWLGCGSARHSFRWDKVIESSLEEKDLWVLIDEANYILDCVKRDVTSWSREMVLLLCSGETPPMQFWCHQDKKDMELLEQV